MNSLKLDTPSSSIVPNIVRDIHVTFYSILANACQSFYISLTNKRTEIIEFASEHSFGIVILTHTDDVCYTLRVFKKTTKKILH